MRQFLTEPWIHVPGHRLPHADWKRIAQQRATRQEIAGTCRILDRVDPDRPCELLDRLGRRPTADVLRTLNSCPGLDYVALISDVRGLHVRCSSRTDDVRKLLLRILDVSRSHPYRPSRSGIESPEATRRRHQIQAAIGRMIERLTERQDMAVVIAWHVDGNCCSHLEHSPTIGRELANKWLRWFARNVLAIQVPRAS